jgi:hypothetical protein
MQQKIYTYIFHSLTLDVLHSSTAVQLLHDNCHKPFEGAHCKPTTRNKQNGHQMCAFNHCTMCICWHALWSIIIIYGNEELPVWRHYRKSLNSDLRTAWKLRNVNKVAKVALFLYLWGNFSQFCLEWHLFLVFHHLTPYSLLGVR